MPEDLTDFDIQIVISHHNAPRSLSNALKEQEIDLAIIAKNNREALENFIVGSTAKELMDIYDGNLLVVPV